MNVKVRRIMVRTEVKFMCAGVITSATQANLHVIILEDGVRTKNKRDEHE